MQLVIRPGMSMPVGVVAHQVQQHAHEFVATSVGAIGRIRHSLSEPGEHAEHLESRCLEAARMSREMDRL